MKQLLVLSGKGGTGKTTIVAAFIHLLNAKAFADCDVDAPNLHLVTSMKTEGEKKDYFGLDKAVVDESLCIKCGKCLEHCRFNAISLLDSRYEVNAYACEGCSVCQMVCPVGAITMNSDIAGELKLFKEERIFSTATLKMGSGTSGRLVTEVKKNLKKGINSNIENHIFEGVDVAVIDGSPGIGCPVIASITGVDLILVVTEPTVSGISDMKRVIEIANHFKIQVAICTNKFDVNQDKTDEIKTYAKNNNLAFVGVVPYDSQVAISINKGINVMQGESQAAKYILEVFNNTMALINN